MDKTTLFGWHKESPDTISLNILSVGDNFEDQKILITKKSNNKFHVYYQINGKNEESGNYMKTEEEAKTLALESIVYE